MVEQLGQGQCGLDFTKGKVNISDSKNFGPEKFRASSMIINCGVNNCNLSEGVEVNFATVTGTTPDEIQDALDSAARSPISSMSANLRQARLEKCPLYQELIKPTR